MKIQDAKEGIRRADGYAVDTETRPVAGAQKLPAGRRAQCGSCGDLP